MYMLDTNIISHIVKQNPKVAAQLKALSSDAVCISSMVYAEVFYGLAKKPSATGLNRKVQSVLSRIRVVGFYEAEAKFYGQFRANMEASGKSLAEMDLLIAAHAQYLGAVLVTADKAFSQITDLAVEDWTV